MLKILTRFELSIFLIESKEFPTYCELIVYLIPMTQRASKFQVSLPEHDVCMRAESLDPDDFSSFHSPIIDCYGGYFLRVEFDGAVARPLLWLVAPG